MRFRRWHRTEPYRDTSRKARAFHRKQRLERERCPSRRPVAAGQHGRRRGNGPSHCLVGRGRTGATAAMRADSLADRPAPVSSALPDERIAAHPCAVSGGPAPIRPIPATSRSPSSDRLSAASIPSPALEVPPELIGADDARIPSSFDDRFPPNRPAQGRRRGEDHGGRTSCCSVRQSRLRYPLLRSRVRLIERHESFYTSSWPSPARLQGRQRRPLRRDRVDGRVL